MPCSNGKTYIVKAGDILYDIAQRELGDGNRWHEIKKIDGTPFTDEDSRNLQVGQEICLPLKSNDSKKLLVGYFESWSDWRIEKGVQLKLSNLAPYVNMVIVSFMMPNATYEKGSYKLGKEVGKDTGLTFSIDGRAVKEEIALLKRKNPGTKVLISVGGDSYSKVGYFEKLNPQVIADVVEDFGFDGVDICFEPYTYFDPPINAKCFRDSSGKMSCTTTDELFRKAVSKIRQVLPRPYILTLAAWSIGAYGEDKWVNSQPSGLPLTGLLLNLLRSPEADLIDQLNVMSYSGGANYDPKETLAAYQNYFRGKIAMGVHVPPEPWSPEGVKKYVYTVPKVRELAQALLDSKADGIMLWSLQYPSSPKEFPTESDPNAEMISKEVCKMLALGDSNAPLFQA